MMPILLPMLVLMSTSHWEATIFILPMLMILMSLKLFNPISSVQAVSPLFSLDSMSTLMIMLTMWITALMIMASSNINTFKYAPSLFLKIVMSLCLTLTLAFSVNNLFSYYFLFEASLIPTLLIILIWGYQPERLEAGVYLIMYTVTASLPLLMSILYLHYHFHTTSFFTPTLSHKMSPLMNLMLMWAFLVKIPLYTMHLWLPKAHVEAPVAGSMILASILLKLGVYGLLRLGCMHPLVIKSGAPLIMSISLWGAVLTAILCMRQTDMKSMIAYSSVSHMALLISGVFSMSSWGWVGALTMMIAHGLTSSMLFALANMYYENTYSRSLIINKGMLFLTPSMALWWFLATAANMAAPPFINLLAEIILITGIMLYSVIALIPLTLLCFFTACYSMILYTSLHHGPPSKHIRYMEAIPLYHTISLLHIAPSLLLILSSTQITMWL